MDGGSKRARMSGEEPAILIVDSGHNVAPPAVYAVAWSDSPFKDAKIPTTPFSLYIPMSFQATPSERFDPEDDEDIDCDITKICNTLNINVKRSYADVYDWLDRKVFEDTAVKVLHPDGGCGLPHKAVITLFLSTHQDEYTII